MAVLHPLGENQPRYTEEQIAEVVQWFDQNSHPILKVDDELVHVITLEQFQLFLSTEKYHPRHFHYPTYNELITEVETLHMETVKVLTIDQILYLLDKWIIEPDIIAELKLAFEIFDTYSHGYLEIYELKQALTTLGKVFNQKEWLEFLRDANVDGLGLIDYKVFAERMAQVEPDLLLLEGQFLYTDPNQDPRFKPPEPEQKEEPELEPKRRRRITIKETDNDLDSRPAPDTQNETEHETQTEPALKTSTEPAPEVQT